MGSTIKPDGFEETLGRRALLQRAIGGGLLLLLPMLPEAAAGQSSWVTVGTSDSFKEGVPTRVILPGQKPVFIVCGKAGRWSAVSAICTHEGGRVRWDGSAQRFVCPLHGAAFSTTGKILRGPARRPLAIYAVRRQGNRVQVSLAKAAVPPTRPTRSDAAGYDERKRYEEHRERHHEEREGHKEREEREER